MTEYTVEEYLRRYPSGHFAELAQLQLDQALAQQGEKKIEIASSDGNPFTQGSMRADIGFKAGDTYTYIDMQLGSKAEKNRLTDTVSQVTGDQVLFANRMILDRLGNTVQAPDGRRYTPRQDQPLEYAVGRKWTTRFGVVLSTGTRTDVEFEFRISGRERITVPAGSFECFVIDGQGNGLNDQGGRLQLRMKRWMAPDKVRRPIVFEIYRRVSGGFVGGGGIRGQEKVLQSDRRELAAYRQA